MKTVFSNAMCAHVWAQQSQEHGHSDSMSFQGATLYSYRTAIGYIPNGAEFGLCALLTCRTYSMTTSSKHMPAAHSAVRGRETFSVPFLSADPEACAANLAYLVQQCKEQVNTCMRFQSWHWTSAIDVQESFAASWQHVTAFAARFKLTAPPDTIVADAAMVWARCERLTAKRADPKYAEKRAAAAESRERAKAAKTERDRAEAFKKNAENIAKWRAGEYVYSRVSDERGGALLRVTDGFKTVQTSWGAEVPAADVRLVLAFYDKVRAEQAAGEIVTWGRSPEALHPDRFTLGNFRLDKILADGSIKAGCHDIHAPEIEHLRTLLG